MAIKYELGEHNSKLTIGIAGVLRGVYGIETKGDNCRYILYTSNGRDFTKNQRDAIKQLLGIDIPEHKEN